MEFKDPYIYQTMLTCIGNKRKLVPHIQKIIQDIVGRLGKPKLTIVDGFAGSSVISRALTPYADHLYTNDLEHYSYLMAKACMITPPHADQVRITEHVVAANALASTGPYVEGILCKHYAPKVTLDIQDGERCFYTRENALIIDTIRHYIATAVEPHLEHYILAPLLNKASIHTNTAGVFKGFYKKDGIGHFGGAGENALERIMKPIRIEGPVWSTEIFTPHISQCDINTLITTLPPTIDIIYLDPPYNQHPYGSNYFMLNVLAENKEPTAMSVVSGIPKDWNKSTYNSHTSAIKSMKHLLTTGLEKSKYILISYNNEGIITPDDWKVLFESYAISEYKIAYDTYKGCRNLKDRPQKVNELLFLVSAL